MIRIETALLAAALNEHPELAKRFMAFLLLRNGQVEADLFDHLFNSSDKRRRLDRSIRAES